VNNRGTLKIDKANGIEYKKKYMVMDDNCRRINMGNILGHQLYLALLAGPTPDAKPGDVSTRFTSICIECNGDLCCRAIFMG
jgi:hypothetical protein